MSDMSDAYAYASNGPIEPFWHRDRINRFFLLPLDKTVLTRIGGLSAAFVASFALLLFGGFGVLLLVFALLAVLVSGVRYGFKIIERSSKGFLRPSDYPLTDDDLVSEYLPYKYAAMNLVFGVLATLLQVLSGGNEFVAVVTWLFFFVAIIPAATMRLVITGSLRGALNPTEMLSLIQRIGKPYAALAAFIFVAELCRSYGLAALAVGGGLSAASLKTGFGFGTIVQLFAAVVRLLVLHLHDLRHGRLRDVSVCRCARYLGDGPRRAGDAQCGQCAHDRRQGAHPRRVDRSDGVGGRDQGGDRFACRMI